MLRNISSFFIVVGYFLLSDNEWWTNVTTKFLVTGMPWYLREKKEDKWALKPLYLNILPIQAEAAKNCYIHCLSWQGPINQILIA